jgi:tetratricopeptide (TPR) repeat protein
MSSSPTFYVAGGTLRQDAPSYVARRADTELYDGLQRGEFCYVLTSRQMGKSSLMVRTAGRLRAEGVKVVVLDLTAVGQNLTPEQWYDGLLMHLGEQLGLEDEIEQFWERHPRVGPLQRWMGVLREVVLPHIKRMDETASDAVHTSIRPHAHTSRLVIFVDEIDTVRSLPFSTDEFFAAIRACYNRRAEDAEFERLTFCLLGVAAPTDLIQDTRMTPFNVGRRIELTDFTEEEAKPLAQGLGNGEMGEWGNETAQAVLRRILYWTGGHPYLTQRLCRAVAEHALTPPHPRAHTVVDQLCEELFLSARARERDDNLVFVRERMLRSDADLASLLDLYAKVRRGKAVRDDERDPLVTILRLSGIARSEGGNLRVRNRIYERVFDPKWILENLPGAEVRRQRVAFRRGVIGAATVMAILFVVMLGWTIQSVRQNRLNLTRKLSDGTTLALETVTYGKKHEFGNVYFRFPVPFPVREVYSASTENDGIVVWLTRRDPGSGKYSSDFNWLALWEAVDEHGCRFGGSGGPGTSSSSNFSVGRVTLEAFPRRKEKFKLRFYDRNGKVAATFDVPVPLPARGPFPMWTTEDLPITKSNGDLSVKLTEMRASAYESSHNNVKFETLQVNPTFRVAQNGKPTQAWDASGTEISDATGNLSRYSGDGFCPYEPALKLRVTFFRNARAQFAPDEIWTVRNVPVQKPNTAKRLSGSRTVQGATLELLAIGGKGQVSYSHSAPKQGSGSHTYGGGSFTIDGRTSNGVTTNTVKGTLPHVSARVTGLVEQRLTLQVKDDRRRDVEVDPASPIVGDDHFWFLKIPPDAKTLNLTFAVHKGRAFEFVVKPPDFQPARKARQAEPHRDRAEKHVNRREYAQAMVEYSKAIELNPGDTLLWRGLTLAQLAVGDAQGYRKTCADMLQRMGNTEKPGDANTMAWMCVLIPNAVTDLTRPVQLAEKSVAARRDWYNLNTLGATLYRAGKFDAAIQRLNEAIKLEGEGGSEFDWLFLAMSHHRLGHAAEARRWLNKAARWMEQNPRPDWGTRLELQLLRREAESVIKGRAEAAQK